MTTWNSADYYAIQMQTTNGARGILHEGPSRREIEDKWPDALDFASVRGNIVWIRLIRAVDRVSAHYTGISQVYDTQSSIIPIEVLKYKEVPHE